MIFSLQLSLHRSTNFLFAGEKSELNSNQKGCNIKTKSGGCEISAGGHLDITLKYHILFEFAKIQVEGNGKRLIYPLLG